VRVSLLVWGVNCWIKVQGVMQVLLIPVANGAKTLRTQDTSDLRHFGTTVMVPSVRKTLRHQCQNVRTLRHHQVLFVHKKKATHTHTVNLITHIMSHVHTTNRWNKPANTMSCDFIVLCSIIFNIYSHESKTLQPALSL